MKFKLHDRVVLLPCSYGVVKAGTPCKIIGVSEDGLPYPYTVKSIISNGKPPKIDVYSASEMAHLF